MIGPHLSIAMPFVRFDADGRITDVGCMEPQYIAAEQAERGGIIAGEGGDDSHYVDMSGPTPLLKTRRNLIVGFDTHQPAPGTPARVTLPENTQITVSGPVTGTVTGGGSVALVLRVPGTYHVTMLAWPRRPVIETLIVPVTPGPVPDPPVGALVVAPSLDAVRERAKDIVTLHYATLALVGRPAGLQPADLLKAQEAAQVLADQPSAWISEEAAERGKDPATLAREIVAESAKTIDREKERVRTTQAIARAGTESEIVSVLQAAGLDFIPSSGL